MTNWKKQKLLLVINHKNKITTLGFDRNLLKKNFQHTYQKCSTKLFNKTNGPGLKKFYRVNNFKLLVKLQIATVERVMSCIVSDKPTPCLSLFTRHETLIWECTIF